MNAVQNFAASINYSKVDAVVIRVLMMCGWIALLNLAGRIPQA